MVLVSCLEVSAGAPEVSKAEGMVLCSDWDTFPFAYQFLAESLAFCGALRLKKRKRGAEFAITVLRIQHFGSVARLGIAMF
jgi:hypothetical protein